MDVETQELTYALYVWHGSLGASSTVRQGQIRRLSHRCRPPAHLWTGPEQERRSAAHSAGPILLSGI